MLLHVGVSPTIGYSPPLLGVVGWCSVDAAMAAGVFSGVCAISDSVLPHESSALPLALPHSAHPKVSVQPSPWHVGHSELPSSSKLMRSSLCTALRTSSILPLPASALRLAFSFRHWRARSSRSSSAYTFGSKSYALNGWSASSGRQPTIRSVSAVSISISSRSAARTTLSRLRLSVISYTQSGFLSPTTLAWLSRIASLMMSRMNFVVHATALLSEKRIVTPFSSSGPVATSGVLVSIFMDPPSAPSCPSRVHLVLMPSPAPCTSMLASRSSTSSNCSGTVLFEAPESITSRVHWLPLIMFARMVSSPAPVGIGISISVAGAGLFPLAAADSFPSAPTDNVIVEALRLSFAYLTTDLSLSRDSLIAGGLPPVVFLAAAGLGRLPLLRPWPSFFLLPLCGHPACRCWSLPHMWHFFFCLGFLQSRA